MRTLKVQVSGRVQGVGYRYFTRKIANKLGILGTVRNLVNGNVEIIAQADIEALDEFIEYLRQGPSMARVSEIDSADITHSAPAFQSFDIVFY
ncbi:acylphosphatase [bacterium]|nr:acylphosphatase [candidate division CSSED10-310 bacterium]